MGIKVLLAASEVAPFAKTGGLSDVAGSLPKAIAEIGHDIRVIMPKYKCVTEKYGSSLEFVLSTYVNVGWRHQYCGIFKTVQNNVTFYFIDNEYYFKRDTLYGHFDEAEQFTFFCKALIEVLPKINFKPDIIHCNDWQTAIVPVLLYAHYKQYDFYKDIKTIFTIHNLRYQGIFPKIILTELLCLDWWYFTPDRLEYNDCVNFMKGGLVFSDLITTVSKTYADEIKTDFFGEGLNGILKNREDKLTGIVNGIDYNMNNPQTDSKIFENFSISDLSGKINNKLKLQEQLGLPVDSQTPLIAIISRLVDQKGFDLIQHVLYEILENEDVQFVVLGTGEYRYEEMFKQAAARFPSKLSANIKYDDTLAQRIYAGSDMFLMPSLFEPCGLSQMFSMRYGTIPLVRETGGLKDTVQPYNEFTGEGTGFGFANYNAHEMLFMIKYAMKIYKDKNRWHKIIRNAMSQDLSWQHSAKEYVELYKKLL